MLEWSHISLIAVSAGLLALVLILTIKRCCLGKSPQNLDERAQSLQTGIARLHQVSPHHHHPPGDSAGKVPNSYALFQRGVSRKSTFFSWSDHPSLVTDAVENGWSRFAFTDFVSSSSPPSVKTARSLLGGCGDSGNEPNVEIGWEVSEGSADFMQKIRLNPNLKKIGATISVVRAALPLPGPNLGNSSFPQEAYFEITILSCNGDAAGEDHLSDRKWKSEGDKIKLIGEDSNKIVKNSPESVSRDSSSHSQKRSKLGEMKIGKQQDARNDGVLLSVGLTCGGPLLSKPPGTFPGSIGFNSTGSVHFDGIKLVFDSENDEWGRSGTVIGCGYNPSQKRVFFTVDSHLAHEINCKPNEYSFPLYPTISSNAETIALLNLGQSPFKFAPANTQRTPNPCFVGPIGTSPALGYEDSRELFSMGRIDAQWQMQRNYTRSNNNTVNSIKSLEYDQESEGEFFEIVLEGNGRSPYGAMHQ